MNFSIILLMAVLLTLGCVTVQASTYYVDSVAGNDANSGTSSNAAWKLLAKVNATTFAPGDRILFKAGSGWTGTLWPKGSGTSNNVITMGSYGGSTRPIINGNGATDAVFLMNQEFWEIADLEVVNNAASDAERRGIHITGSNYVNTVIDHIHIRNCYIHNIRGTLSATDGDILAKRTGGIIVEVLDDTPTPTRFNDILIEGNTITSVRNQGIVAAGNRSGQSDFPGTAAWNARKVSNLVIRSNTISDVTKNALILRLADNTCLVEWNVCYDTATLDTGNTMFTAACDGAVFQLNEGYRNLAGVRDGSLYDADLRSVNIVFQYSYSHDNSHGLFWNYPSASGPNSNIVVRYNISRNDRGNIFSFSGDAAGQSTTYIYNNTIYLPPGSTNLVCDARNGIHTYFMSNNIFYIEGAGVSYDFGSTNTTTAVFDHNTFYGVHPASEPPDAHKLTNDPMFVAVGTGTNGLGSLVGYQLQSGSPCINSGVTIPGNLRDFFGNPVPQGGATDRGAAEYVFTPPAILQPPQSLNVTNGDTASIFVVASGSTPLTYQWRKGGAPISGATGTHYFIAAVSTTDAGSYDVVVSNIVGAVTSSVAALTVVLPPASNSGVVIAEVYNGGGKAGATFNRDYVVLKNISGAPISIANWSLQHLKAGVWQAPFALPGTNILAGGFFLVQCYYDGGTAVGASPVADAVATQSSVWNLATASAGAVALVNNTNPTTCGSSNIMDIVGWFATAGNCYEGSATVAPGGPTQSNQRLSNGCQDTDSNPDDFSLSTPTGRNSLTAPSSCSGVVPVITSQPASQSVTAGANVSFSVTASGSAPLNYQWRKGGAAVGGATSATYGLDNVTTNDAGSFSVVVTNLSGSVTSAVATLTVTAAVAQNGTNYDVYLVGGQSNADGRGATGDLTNGLAYWQLPQTDIRIYYANPVNLDPLNPTYNTGWSVLTPGFSVPPGFSGVLPSTVFGPELSFARTVADASTNRHLALIKVTQGGTSLSADWNPASGYMYAALTNMARAALTALANEGSTHTLRGMIWHQGESDGSLSTASYQAKLTDFINAVRRDFAMTNLPVVVGELATNRSLTVRQAQFNVAEIMPYVGFASSSNLPTLATNDPHFTATSQLTMGQRMAGALEVPPLRFGAINLAGNNVLLSATGLAQSCCRLLGATNLSLPVSQWSLISTGRFDASGWLAFTNAVAPANMAWFYFLVEE